MLEYIKKKLFKNILLLDFAKYFVIFSIYIGVIEKETDKRLNDIFIILFNSFIFSFLTQLCVNKILHILHIFSHCFNNRLPRAFCTPGYF